MSIGRIYFLTESEMNAIAFRENQNGIPMILIMVTECLAFILKWLIFVRMLLKNTLRCSKEKKKDFFTVLSFITSSNSVVLTCIGGALSLGRTLANNDVILFYAFGLIYILMFTISMWFVSFFKYCCVCYFLWAWGCIKLPEEVKTENAEVDL